MYKVGVIDACLTLVQPLARRVDKDCHGIREIYDDIDSESKLLSGAEK